ncbi:hypothetical protein AQUCO_00200226v1 [Aquilegia coerulea]|uniref:SKP1 component dimerisation domain-containing protein n=1 Tax=Aquilegia coerulea TaxID=218851 RepID=A0A2G5F262_AQUCA|nr:hypothetical protein AQUCO_00200226v1 [Aquilegia coerulea]
MIEDGYVDEISILPSIDVCALKMVIKYCEKHFDQISSSEEMKKWDAKFVDVDPPILQELLLAATDLEIQGLVDIITQKFADIITGKTVEELREMFLIENDWTPEEEAAIREENAWAFK